MNKQYRRFRFIILSLVPFCLIYPIKIEWGFVIDPKFLLLSTGLRKDLGNRKKLANAYKDVFEIDLSSIPSSLAAPSSAVEFESTVPYFH